MTPRLQLDSDILNRIDGQGFLAPRGIHDLRSGPHSSAALGMSRSFAEHRPYTAGDDVRRVDWKVYARTDRLHLRAGEHESALACHLILDSSASMRYQGRRGLQSKHQFAALAIGSLAWLAHRLHDFWSVSSLSGIQSHRLPVAGGSSHLEASLALLGATACSGDGFWEHLQKESNRFSTSAVLVIATDCFDDVSVIRNSLTACATGGRNVILLHVCDPDELDLQTGHHATRFTGLETDQQIDTDCPSIRGAYRDVLRDHLKQLDTACHTLRVQRTLLSTNAPLGDALAFAIRQQRERHLTSRSDLIFLTGTPDSQRPPRSLS